MMKSVIYNMKATVINEQDVLSTYLKSKGLVDCAKKMKISTNRLKNILMKNGIHVSMRKHTLDIDFFETIKSPEVAYWLGFIIADGYLTQAHNKLSLKVKDKDILPKFKKCINAGSPVREAFPFDKRTGKNYCSQSIQICSKDFCKHLLNLGVSNAKSQKCLPPPMREEFYSHFVRGVFDGDGGFFMKKAHIKYAGILKICGTEDILKFIQEIVYKKININSKLSQSKYKNLFYLHFQKKDFKPFLDWIYSESHSDIRLDRKYISYEFLNSIFGTPEW